MHIYTMTEMKKVKMQSEIRNYFNDGKNKLNRNMSKLFTVQVGPTLVRRNNITIYCKSIYVRVGQKIAKNSNREN